MFYQLLQIYNLKFSLWDQYFWWSKVVKLGPIQNQTYEILSKATFAYFSRFCLLLWSPQTIDYGKSDIFIKWIFSFKKIWKKLATSLDDF